MCDVSSTVGLTRCYKTEGFYAFIFLHGHKHRVHRKIIKETQYSLKRNNKTGLYIVRTLDLGKYKPMGSVLVLQSCNRCD